MSTADKYNAARLRMVSEQLLDRGISDARVLAAMSRVPREQFLVGTHRSEAYADRALPIDCQQTISQPYIVALMTEALELTGNEHVLEVGTGSGYQAAVLAELSASVVTIERHSMLAHHAAQTLANLGYANVQVIEGDGTLGWQDGAPYDRVLVAASTVSVPNALWAQLVEGGMMAIPLGEIDSQMLRALQKIDGNPVKKSLCACRFVPLVPGTAVDP